MTQLRLFDVNIIGFNKDSPFFELKFKAYYTNKVRIMKNLDLRNIWRHEQWSHDGDDELYYKYVITGTFIFCKGLIILSSTLPEEPLIRRN